MSKTIIVTFSDSNYFELLKELLSSIKRFPQSSNISVGILDGGLDQEQIKYLRKYTNLIKKSEWDIEVNKNRSNFIGFDTPNRS